MAQELFTACSSAELERIHQIVHAFDIPDGHITNLKPMKSGRLNETLLVCENTIDGFKKYVLQKVNNKVFTDPVRLMENIISVTRHILAKGGTTIHFHGVKDAKVSPYLYYDEAEKAYYRLYDFIEADFKNKVTSANDMYTVGKAIGEFSKMLDDFDASQLVETIPNFHDTAKRFEHFQHVCLNDMFKGRSEELNGKDSYRIDTCREEIHFIEERAKHAGLIVEALKDDIIPMRVSHNDPKLNNVIIALYTGEALGFIDLDTVMPGTVLYDFGDAARFGCNTADEEETDFSKVHFNLEYFRALTKGLFESMKEVITIDEVNYLSDSVWMMTYELAIRFLDDHIDGNKYFGVEYDGKNLERARVQMQLLASIEDQWDEMGESIIETWCEIVK